MKYALTCLAGLTAMGLVALAPARHRYGGYAYRHRPYYYDRSVTVIGTSEHQF
jgi:hypothetical protein